MSLSHSLSKEFKKMDKRRTFGLLGFLLILAFFPIIFASSNEKQETRSHAAATTSLSFFPPSSFTNPIQGSVGQPLSIDLMMAPGNNSVTNLRVHIVFPKRTFSIATARFEVNQALFNIVEAPRVTEGANGDINFTVSAKAPIGYEAKVGTMTLVPQIVVNTANQNDGVVGFLPPTSATSVRAGDSPTENVIAQLNQAYIFVSAGSAPTPVLPTGPSGQPSGQPGGGQTTTPSSIPMNVPPMEETQAYSPQPSIWLFIVPIVITFFTILFY